MAIALLRVDPVVLLLPGLDDDTLLKMSNGGSIMGERNYSAAMVKNLVGRTNSIYMLANQLPLLELSEVSNPVSSRPKPAVRTLAGIRAENRPGRGLLMRIELPLTGAA